MATKNKELEVFTFDQIKDEFIGEIGTEKRTRYEQELQDKTQNHSLMKNNPVKPLYCNSLFQYKRNNSTEVIVGNLKFGGIYHVRIQSMTTTDTMNAEETANQSVSIFEAGGEMVRITTQGQREAANLTAIRKEIEKKGCDFPLVADIHFNPSAALVAASIVEKVRINPGNFADGAKKFKIVEYDEDSYRAEVKNIETKLIPFLETCKKHNTAIRIGVNHGSLSDRIMARYGDTPEGMVESCMEYLRICCDNDFHKIVLSIKSSNTRVMFHTVRLLVASMKNEGMNFPLHLGVTEAGSGEDGRVKSAVGIGALMTDGLGDTIRVSLTENPENEIPVAQTIVSHFEAFENHKPIKPVPTNTYSPYDYTKRKAHQVFMFGGDNVPMVVADFRGRDFCSETKDCPDAVVLDNQIEDDLLNKQIISIIPANKIKNRTANILPLYNKSTIKNAEIESPIVLEINYEETDNEIIDFLKKRNDVIILLTTNNENGVSEQRAFFLMLNNFGLTNPVIIHRKYSASDKETFQIKSAADTGLLFLDGFGDGISLSATKIDANDLIDTHFAILQASRVRFSRTEYISCPGCGRTLFDLQKTAEKIREKTSHLKGLKIAVMGCIVNGIGEMADADYGYVGAGAGRISLFKNRELISKNIPEKEAVDNLVELIKQGGHWHD